MCPHDEKFRKLNVSKDNTMEMQHCLEKDIVALAHSGQIEDNVHEESEKEGGMGTVTHKKHQ